MNGKKERQDVRVRDFVRLRVIRVGEEARQAVLDQIALERLTSGLDDSIYHSERMARDMREHVEIPNQHIVSMLQALDAKLDALMMYLMDKDVQAKWGQPEPVDISASGIRFPSSESYTTGELLRLEFVLQTYPPHPIITLADVMRIDQQDPAWNSEKDNRIAAKFIDLDSTDRDRIVKRVFDVQRMLLRRNKEANQTDDYQ